MSVLSISGTVVPTQLSELSPDALRNGKIASETTGAVGVFALGPNRLPRSKNPVIDKTRTAAMPPTQGQGIVCPHVPTAGKCRVAAAPLPCQALRSVKISLALW